MPFTSARRSRDPIRVVLSSAALLPFMSVWRAAAFPIAQLGAAAFFIAGVVAPTLGASAGWFVLAAAALAALLRAIDIESWAFLIPGGLVRRVAYAFGGRAARAATAVALVERLVLGALASVVVGHYIADVLVMAIAGLRFEGSVGAEDLATLSAVVLVGWLWLRARIGRDIDQDLWARSVWVGIGILALTTVIGVITLARDGAGFVTTLVAGRRPDRLVVPRRCARVCVGIRDSAARRWRW